MNSTDSGFLVWGFLVWGSLVRGTLTRGTLTRGSWLAAVALIFLGAPAVSAQTDPEWRLALENREAYYSVADPARELSVTLSMSHVTGPSVRAQGLSVGVANDPSLITPVSVRAVGQIEYLSGGGSVEFFAPSFFADGWTVGLIFGGFNLIFFSSTLEPVIEVTYTTQAQSLLGGIVETPLTFTGSLGVPPVALSVVGASGHTEPVALEDGSVTLVPFVGGLFRRGDCNADGPVNLADAITILSELFAAGVVASCPAACDANSDGQYDIADPVYLVNYLLFEGDPPAAPFDECGADDLGWSCADDNPCP